jgi:muramoyltetrapeptide carboxypeptidase LdcA involved in peptidoglycan recycling
LQDLDGAIGPLASAYGLEVDLHLEDLNMADGYYANSIQNRAAAVWRHIQDPDAHWLWVGKAGFGGLEAVSALETQKVPCRTALRAMKKAFVGFSDATIWHLWSQSFGWPFLHAPNLVNVKELSSVLSPGANRETTCGELFSILSGKVNRIEKGLQIWIKPQKPLPKSITLLGGNFSVLLRTLAHPWLGLTREKLQGKWLFLEDTAEDWNRALSLLTTLAASGILDGCLGIVFGDFPIVGGGHDLQSLVLKWNAEVLKKIFNIDLVILYLNDCGHGLLNQVLPLNVQAFVSAGGDDVQLQF